MDTKWLELISQRTSSPGVLVEAAQFFSGIPDFDDASDFQGIKSGLVRSITDLMVGAERTPGTLGGFPFRDVSSVLDLMRCVAGHRRNFSHLYAYPIVPDDLRMEMEFETGCQIHELVTPESVLVMVDWNGDGILRSSDPAPTNFWTLIAGDGVHVALFATSAKTFCGMVQLRPTTAPVHWHIIEFIAAEKMALLHPCALTGMVQATDGSMHYLSTLPEGITIDGDLTIPRTFQRLDKLPRNMTINGNLTVEGSRSLTALPDDLSVGGSLWVTDCERLLSIGNGTSVGGDTTLYGNPALSVVGRGCRFGGDLKLDSRKLLAQDFNLVGDAIVGISKNARRVAYPPGIVARVLGGRL